MPTLARTTRRRRALTGGACLSLLTVSAVGAATVAPASAAGVPMMLEERVTPAGIEEHLRALQGIADRNDGTRALGTPGYAASVRYVADRARAAGYDVTLQAFPADVFEERSPAELEQLAPNPTTYVNAGEVEEGGDFAVMSFSGGGEASGPVTAVDVVLGPGNASDSGCSTDLDGTTPEDDFVDFPAGAIALIQRGTCTFAEKATNAQAAGASGVIIFNQGNTPDRTEVIAGTLGQRAGSTIPVVGTSYALGAELVGLVDDGLRMRIAVDATVRTEQTTNVLAETPGGNPDNVVMVGAHLDSVPEGPGINDNGSGTASILEVAEQLARFTPANKVRFAWWGAEEEGLVGSTYFVDDLAANQPDELERIALYLNFDMVGSPNYVRFVYDSDGSDFGTPGPEGSAYIEQFFRQVHFGKRGLATDPTEFSGRSDYVQFVAAGIPAGGLFSGAEGVKTAEQARVYGGRAGVAYDECYHQECDTIGNVNRRAIDQFSNAIAHATAAFARSTGPVNGVRPRVTSATERAARTAGSEWLGSHLAR